MSTPRFLIIRGGAIGDFILTVPVIAAIREKWQSAHIEVLGYPHIAEIAKGPELVNAVRSISARGMATFFAERGERDREFIEYFGQFQQIISFLYDPDEVFSTNVKRISRRFLAGIHKPTEPEPPVKPIHACLQYVKVLESLAMWIVEPVPKLYPQQAERLFAIDYYRGHAPSPLVAVHPGSGGEAKLWAIENWAALCRWLIEEKKAEVLVVAGEADQSQLNQLLALLKPHHVLVANHLKLAQVAAVLEKATVYLGHDSGISHLAAAVGVPSVVLFGPTNPAVWRPQGEKVRILHGATEWIADREQPFWQKPMNAIPVVAVKKVVEETLAAR
jgi:heptosyltransferase-2